MKKGIKGQGGMLVIVLTIILALAGIIILWNVVNATLTKSSSHVNIDRFSYRGNMDYSISSDNNSINVSVRRETGGENITGVRIIFEKSGNTYIYTNTNYYPKELETKTYYISAFDSNISPAIGSFSNVSKISIYFLINDSKKLELTTAIDSKTSSSQETSGETAPTVPSCSYSSWVNQFCGISGCLLGQMYQNRSVISGSSCTDTFQCVSNNTCSLIASAVSYLTFDTNYSNVFVDLLARNNGSCTGSSCPIWNKSLKYGGSYIFDGNNDYILIPDSDKYTNYTISLWINRRDLSSTNPLNIILRSDSSGPITSLSDQLRIESDKIIFYNWDGWMKFVIGTTTINRGNWYNIVAVAQNSSFMRLYINGVQESSDTVINSLWVGDRWYIGIAASSPITYFNGSVDEVIIFNKTLSTSEISTIYNYQKNKIS